MPKIVHTEENSVRRLDIFDDGSYCILYREGETERWFDNEHKLHRTDGPAIRDEYEGAIEWWTHGRLHRIDGPAKRELHFDQHTGKELWVDRWYLNDKRLNGDEVNQWLTANSIDLRKEEHQVLFVARFS